jgi:hypothetical protein
LLLAQVAVESGHGKKLKNNNPGNVMAGFFRGGGDTEVFTSEDDYYHAPWFDDPDHPQYRNMRDGKEPSSFRSYSTLDAGVRQYLSTVARLLPEAVHSGDAQEFGNAIRTSRYCPACPASLGDTLGQLVAGYERKGYFSSLPHAPKSKLGAFTLLAGGAAAFGLLKLSGKKRT